MDAIQQSVAQHPEEGGLNAMSSRAEMSLKERPFFFQNGDYMLFGILHRPVNHDAKGVVVCCHPFGEEKLWSQRIFVNFSRRLANEGFAVLRFDYMGHGDSQGQFGDSNIESHLSDIRCAISEARKEYPEVKKVCLLGLRMGATLAAIVAEESSDVDHLVLWDPTVDMKKFMQMTLRSNLTAQMAAHKKIVLNREQMIENMKKGQPLNIEGYELSYSYYEQACAINLIKTDKRFSGNSLIVQIGKEGQPINKQLEVLGSMYKHTNVEHVVEEQFWKEIKYFCETAENLFATTMDWMVGQYG